MDFVLNLVNRTTRTVSDTFTVTGTGFRIIPGTKRSPCGPRFRLR